MYMYKIIYSLTAEDELATIYNYIAADNPFYAEDVLDRIRRSIDFLKQFPNIWTHIWWDIRYIVEPKYKFKIVYRYDATGIAIISIYKYRENWTLRNEQ